MIGDTGRRFGGKFLDRKSAPIGGVDAAKIRHTAKMGLIQRRAAEQITNNARGRQNPVFFVRDEPSLWNSADNEPR
ncbi:MAG: hypothetical protein P4L90_14785 [Rhodopila sp.]|nr:hypothetical protein [Rhodopila sp.]